MSVDLESSTYIDFNKESNKDDPKLKVGDKARISKYKNIFRKRYVPNPSEVFFIKKIKIIVVWTYIISDLEEELAKIFYEKELQRTTKKRICS